MVRTGGIRFGIRMARPKCLAVYGITALSMAPSRTCRCQSSGLRMVRRVVMAYLLAGRALACALYQNQNFFQFLYDARCR